MKLIKSEKISYTYPVLQETDDFDGRTTVDEKKTSLAKPAINGISLEVEEGQFICILGRNGSGKSTFARHLNALLVPDEGTLWIQDIKSSDESRVWDIRSLVGMVFQNPDNQIIGSVVDEDVAFGPENIGIPSEQIVKEVEKALSDINMSEYAKASPNKLSGGQKQRVAIAGILAMHPRCIVLDESTSMLDPRGRKDVMEAVLRLNKEHGITIISITHYMEEALNADRIFVMDKGELVMEGNPKEIFSQPEKLDEIGLKLPEICALAYELRKAGLDIPEGITESGELEETILKICGK